MDGLPREIHEGMKVCDRAQHEIGTVEWVKFGDEDPTSPGPETADVNPIERSWRGSLIENIADVFRTDDLPEELQERLLREGFVRVDAKGLLAADRYVLPDQIQSVSGDRLILNVDRDDLVKAH